MRRPWRRRSANFLLQPDQRFEMMLARDLSMTRDQLRRCMSTAEFTDWLALYTLEAEEREREMRSRQR